MKLEKALECKEVLKRGDEGYEDTLLSIIIKQTEIQTLILDKDVFPKRSDATKWARDHDFRADKVDENENSFRLRQRNPGDFQEGSFRTIELANGVKAVIGKPKKSDSKTNKGFWKELFQGEQC